MIFMILFPQKDMQHYYATNIDNQIMLMYTIIYFYAIIYSK